MNNIKWILFISSRYFKAKRKNRNLSTAFFSVAGIAIGVTAMIAILGVMNGFQMGFIDDILEINSFHIRINSSEKAVDPGFMAKIKKNREIKSVLPFIDLQSLGKGDFSDFRACTVRAVPINTPELDPDLLKYLGIIKGHFNLTNSNAVIIGSEYAKILDVGIGDEISFISMAGKSFSSLSPVEKPFVVKGIFRSGYYEYDSTMAFISMEAVPEIASGKELITYGIKLKNRYRDKQAVSLLKDYEHSGMNIVSWREYNRSFFGALRMEKISMILIVGLIFLVVGVNIKHSLERAVYKHREDIGVLRSLGAVPGAVKTIFVAEGVLTGVAGGLAGVILGLTVTVNINNIFSFFSKLAVFLSSVFEFVFSPFLQTTGISLQLFSPVYFYIREVPVKILFHEVLFIFFFAILASTGAAYSASSKISEFNPAEILRYE